MYIHVCMKENTNTTRQYSFTVYLHTLLRVERREGGKGGREGRGGGKGGKGGGGEGGGREGRREGGKGGREGREEEKVLNSRYRTQLKGRNYHHRHRFNYNLLCTCIYMIVHVLNTHAF